MASEGVRASLRSAIDISQSPEGVQSRKRPTLCKKTQRVEAATYFMRYVERGNVVPGKIGGKG